VVFTIPAEGCLAGIELTSMTAFIVVDGSKHIAQFAAIGKNQSGQALREL
jgi:hypothetical protein